MSTIITNLSSETPLVYTPCEQLKSHLEELWGEMARDDEPANPQVGEVKRLIHSRDYEGAWRVLRKCFALDAEMLNLCGVLHELEGEFEKAKQNYCAARKRDNSLEAAEHNLRRCYELWTFGQSKIPICL